MRISPKEKGIHTEVSENSRPEHTHWSGWWSALCNQRRPVRLHQERCRRTFLTLALSL